MDIYGKLNNEVVKKEYAGSTTDTAKTIVDNTSNVIKTEVIRVPGKLTIDIEDTDIDYIYDGSEDIPVKIPTVGTVGRIEQKVNELDAEINGSQPESIVNQISALKQADIDETQTRLNADERLEDLIDTEQQSRQDADTLIEANAQKIQIEEEIDSETGEKTGRLEFYEYGSDNVTRYIQGGFQPDNKTIELNSERKLAGKVSSKLNLGMVYAWVDQNGKAYISVTDPEEVIINVETLPDGSEAYDIETYNYSVQLLPNGSSEYNIGE